MCERADVADPTQVWRWRAELRKARGEDPSPAVAEGLGAATRALQLDATRAVAWAERAALEDLAGRPEEAAEARSEALRLDPLLAGDLSAGGSR